MAKDFKKNNRKITKIQVTNDTLTGRSGLLFFVKYLTSINFFQLFHKHFYFLKKSKKGQTVVNICKQIICFFMDGTSFALTRFDQLKNDRGYACTIENTSKMMCSSHAVKRFFQRFSPATIWLFRIILLQLFIWRLKLEKPNVIKLGIDTMVLDNDESLKKQGVEPTYKKKKGFQPLQMTWGPYIIDAIFRSGKKHSNYSNHVIKMVKTVVNKIRKEYSKDVPVILRADTGFFDNHNFSAFENMEIAYIAGGKLYNDIKEYVDKTPKECFGSCKNRTNIWDYIELGDKRGTWTKYRRAFYTTVRKEKEQLILEFARPDSIIYTNIGVDQEITEKLRTALTEDCIAPEWIIREYHARGADELVHKGLKDLGTEQMPFFRFTANAAFYYMMVIAFNLFECCKRDAAREILPVSSLAKTFRRKLIDFAGKIVFHAKQQVLKVSRSCYNDLQLNKLWKLCNSPPDVHLI